MIEPAYETAAPSGAGTTTVSEFMVVTVPDVLLVGSAGLPITRSGRVIKEPVSAPRGNLYLPAIERAVAELGLRRLLSLIWLPRRARRDGTLPSTPAGVHVITGASPRPGGSQYGHWLLEHAGQIAAVESIADRFMPDIPYITNGDVAEYQASLFDALGVVPGRIIPHREPIRRFERLVIATLRNTHSRGSEYDPRLHRRIRRALAPKLSGSPADEKAGKEVSHPRLALALREDDAHRHALNASAVAQLTEAYGTYSIRNGVPLNVEVDVLRNCDVLVGIFGAGLAKMLLCSNLRHVVELAPPGRAYDVYENLATGLGVRFQRIVGALPEGAQRRGKNHGKNADFIVPIAALEAALDAITADLDGA